jgi:hypothetical protein
MLETIKNALHLTDSDMDDELTADISSALEDMRRVGVTAAVSETENPLVIKCVELYVKWQQSYLGEPERFQKHYERLRDSLSMGSDYNAEN